MSPKQRGIGFLCNSIWVVSCSAGNHSSNKINWLSTPRFPSFSFDAAHHHPRVSILKCQGYSHTAITRTQSIVMTCEVNDHHHYLICSLLDPHSFCLKSPRNYEHRNTLHYCMRGAPYFFFSLRSAFRLDDLIFSVLCLMRRA
ncbi:hypothetical protein BX666DRAFT_2006617 [Dichotomocladium elegans]|nr:hypothetical protein BX666DRAFT_2006617 [Dichotomocladium elegans]